MILFLEGIDYFLPKQPLPWKPWLQLQNPVVWSHNPLPLHGNSPPGHDISGEVDIFL